MVFAPFLWSNLAPPTHPPAEELEWWTQLHLLATDIKADQRRSPLSALWQYHWAKIVNNGLSPPPVPWHLSKIEQSLNYLLMLFRISAQTSGCYPLKSAGLPLMLPLACMHLMQTFKTSSNLWISLSFVDRRRDGIQIPTWRKMSHLY